jgi:hypothetical protein
VSDEIEVWLGYGAPAEQLHEVGDLFREEGISVEVRTPDAPPPVGNGVGVTIIAYLLGMTVGQFLSGYFQAAGQDAWRKSKDLVLKLKRNHLDRHPSVPSTAPALLVIKDVERRISVGLESDMPDEAFRKLFDLDFGDQEQVSWNWNQERGEWEPYDLSGHPDWMDHTQNDLRYRLKRLRRRLFRR